MLNEIDNIIGGAFLALYVKHTPDGEHIILEQCSNGEDENESDSDDEEKEETDFCIFKHEPSEYTAANIWVNVMLVLYFTIIFRNLHFYILSFFGYQPLTYEFQAQKAGVWNSSFIQIWIDPG